MSTSAADSPPEATPVSFGVLRDEIAAFKSDCESRYRFNSYWDNAMNLAGLALSVGIIAAGAFGANKTSTILGGAVAAIITAQRAFPFGQRAYFYRVLIGETANLLTDIQVAEITLDGAASALKSLRLDYAQQLPRGTGIQARVGGSHPE